MSQAQQRRPQGEPIRYGDVFPVQGELAGEAVAPQDAAMMQSAENQVIGKTQKGGPASIMQSAATYNERAGLVGHLDTSDVPADQGVTVTEADLPGRRVVTEAVGGQVVAHYVTPEPVGTTTPGGVLQRGAITIGEALEATARTVGDKPVEPSDAAAIQAAETRATGLNETIPGGIAAKAQSAADVNARTMRDEDKTTLGDVLGDATALLPADKAATSEDAEKVMGAEIRNKPDMATRTGGVASSVAAAARLNRDRP